MGDSVKGGDIYGAFPTQHLNGPDDANNRRVWIPTTSLDQYRATLATWFGVDPTKLKQGVSEPGQLHNTAAGVSVGE